MTPAARRPVGLRARALVPVLLVTACSAPAGAGGPDSTRAAAGAASAAGSAGAAGSPGAGAVSTASCSGTACSVTLAGTGSSVAVPGGVLTLDAVRDGRAAIRVDGRDVTCREGQRASAGPVPLTCTAVTGDAVTLTVPIG